MQPCGSGASLFCPPTIDDILWLFSANDKGELIEQIDPVEKNFA